MNIRSFYKIGLLLLLIIPMLSYGTPNENVKLLKSKSRHQSLTERKGDLAYQDAKFAIAAEYYQKCLTEPATPRTEILPKLADCYWQMRDCPAALKTYEQLYNSPDKASNDTHKRRIAELYARNGNYLLAASWMKDILGYQAKAAFFAQTDSINRAKKDSTHWNLRFSSMNTGYREFSPYLANDKLFFSSNKPGPEKTKAFGWDGNNFARLWEIPVANLSSTALDSIQKLVAKNKLSGLTNPNLASIYECADNKIKDAAVAMLMSDPNLNGSTRLLGSPVQGLNEVDLNAGGVSMDKYNHFYFSSNYKTADKDGVNRIGLMEGTYTSGGLTNIVQLPFGDANAYSVMHPAINAEGTLLVCSSDKSNGKGGYDLYYTQRKNNTMLWDSLKAFGNNVNTAGNEVFPSITNNNYLYFSSDLLPGLGGLDIFKISLIDALAGTGKPEHINYPVNSSSDDFGWMQQDTLGYKGYFTSDRLNSDDNLYTFVYTPPVIIPKKSFLEGFVVEKNIHKPIAGATVFAYNQAEDTVYIGKTDQNGKYHIPILTSSQVIIRAIDGRFNEDDCLSTHTVYEEQPKDTIQQAPRNLELNLYKVGYVWKLNNIHYDYNKWNIRSDAAPILDSLVTLLKKQPITVELGSHTDSRGKTKYNQTLSQKRAESAVAYLVQHGVKAKRIKAKGYGESQLLNKCADGVNCSEEEHQANRRTEVKVTGYTIPQKKKNRIDPDKFADGQKLNKKDLPKGFFDGCK